MIEIKFRGWDTTEKKMYQWNSQFFSDLSPVTQYGSDFPELNGEIVLVKFTGLYDKNGKEGYFDSDIWEIKNYEYSVKQYSGFITKKCNLRFILHQGLLEVEYELINPPPDLDHITLCTIFNLPLASGRRTFVDDNRQKLEIIGTIQENPELLK